jgi:hypothetical protein
MLLLASSVCGLFKWRQFEPEVLLLAVGWYLRFSLSYRDVEELLAERGAFGRPRHGLEVGAELCSELERCLRQKLRPTNDSWRVDKTYIRVKGKWLYLRKLTPEQTTSHGVALGLRRCASRTGLLRDVAPIQYWLSVATNGFALGGGGTRPLRICSGVTNSP